MVGKCIPKPGYAAEIKTPSCGKLMVKLVEGTSGVGRRGAQGARAPPSPLGLVMPKPLTVIIITKHLLVALLHMSIGSRGAFLPLYFLCCVRKHTPSIISP